VIPIRRALSLVRLQPFDSSTPEGRARERHRRIALTALASAAARGIGVLTVFVTVPLTLGYLGTERYGLWMTVASTLALLAFADLGLSNGLLTMIAQASGRDDWSACKRYVSSAFFMLSAVALFLAAAFVLGYQSIPWAAVFNVTSPEATREAGPAVAVAFACFALNIPVVSIVQAQAALQEGFVNHAWTAFGSVVGLLGVLVVIDLEGGLPWLVLAFSGGPLLASLLNAAVFLTLRQPALRPSLRAVHRFDATSLLHTGGLFLALQVAMIVGYQSDTIVIAQVLGADAVSQYVVPAKAAAFGSMFVSLALAPLWPAYGEALARGDVSWVRRTLRRSLALSLLATAPVAIILVAFGHALVQWWAGSAIDPSPLLLIGLAIWSMLVALGAPLAMLFNGARVVRLQVVCASLMAVVSVTLSIALTSRIGVAGAVYGAIIAQSVCILVPYLAYLPRVLRQAGSVGTNTAASQAVEQTSGAN